jgi:hypothetical protein
MSFDASSKIRSAIHRAVLMGNQIPQTRRGAEPICERVFEHVSIGQDHEGVVSGSTSRIRATASRMAAIFFARTASSTTPGCGQDAAGRQRLDRAKIPDILSLTWTMLPAGS